MFSSLRPHTTTLVLPHSAGWAVWALLALGCANPGPPRPPSLNLPAPVRDLKLQRVGDRLEASWTTPRLTTEKTAIPGPITAVLCRENASSFIGTPIRTTGIPAAATPPSGPCAEQARQKVVPGASAVTVTLAPDFAAGPPRVLVYRVELSNARGRSAGRSNAGWALAGAAPKAAGPIQAAARPEGVLVTWQSASPLADNGTMELLRRTLVAAPMSKNSRSPVSSSLRSRASTAAAHPPIAGTAEEVRLAASAVEGSVLPGSSQQPVDPGGLLDRSVESGATYSYIAQRVREVTLAGHALQMLGEASAPARLAYRDVFPPSAPTGLEAVPEGGFAAAGQTSALSVDLSWEPSPESDTAGYNVYRSDAAGQFLRLNSVPVAASAYRDATAATGKGYRYRVTAVDVHHNESGPSKEVEVQLQP